MSNQTQPGDTAPLGRITFLSGKTAYGPEERGRALAEKQAHWEAERKRNFQKAMNLQHPEGLCQIKTSSGIVERLGGAKPWLK